MTLAAVGLGANLGDVARSVRDAIDALGQLPGTRLVQASRLYRTPAWGVTAQPDFINAVALLDTGLSARALLEALLDIERVHGRVRVDGERWGPRTLDLDLLLHGDAIIDEAGLRVPHPHLHERAFALMPLYGSSGVAMGVAIGSVAVAILLGFAAANLTRSRP